MLEELLLTAVAPELETILTYKGVWALCTVDKSGRVLRATHYASVLMGGSVPMWGVWLVSGRFVRFATYRSQIESAYPRLVWRRKMATYSLIDITDKSVETRRAELSAVYGKKVPC